MRYGRLGEGGAGGRKVFDEYAMKLKMGGVTVGGWVCFGTPVRCGYACEVQGCWVGVGWVLRVVGRVLVEVG